MRFERFRASRNEWFSLFLEAGIKQLEQSLCLQTCQYLALLKFKTCTSPMDVSCKFCFFHLFNFLSRKISKASVFSVFFHEVKHYNVRELVEPGFWKKVQMWLEGFTSPKNEILRVLEKLLSIEVYFFLFSYKTSNGFLTFCGNSMFGNILVLKFWFKNLKVNQNAGFFKLQYHKYVEVWSWFFGTRGSWKQQILVVCFK